MAGYEHLPRNSRKTNDVLELHVGGVSLLLLFLSAFQVSIGDVAQLEPLC